MGCVGAKVKSSYYDKYFGVNYDKNMGNKLGDFGHYHLREDTCKRGATYVVNTQPICTSTPIYVPPPQTVAPPPASCQVQASPVCHMSYHVAGCAPAPAPLYRSRDAPHIDHERLNYVYSQEQLDRANNKFVPIRHHRADEWNHSGASESPSAISQRLYLTVENLDTYNDMIMRRQEQYSASHKKKPSSKKKNTRRTVVKFKDEI